MAAFVERSSPSNHGVTNKMRIVAKTQKTFKGISHFEGHMSSCIMQLLHTQMLRIRHVVDAIKISTAAQFKSTITFRIIKPLSTKLLTYRAFIAYIRVLIYYNSMYMSLREKHFLCLHSHSVLKPQPHSHNDVHEFRTDAWPFILCSS